MINLNLTGKVNAVTLDQSFKWITMPFKRLPEVKNAAILSFIFTGICLAIFKLCSLTTSLAGLFILFLPIIIGSIVLNFHRTFHEQDFKPNFYTSFHAPYFSRLMKVSLVFMAVFILCVLLIILAFIKSGLYSDDCLKVINNLLSLLMSERNNALFSGNLDDIAARLGSTREVLEKLIRGLVIVFSLGLLMMAFLVPWLFMCCSFAVFSYNDAKENKINFYWLAFSSFFKIRNWLSYFLYGFTMFLIQQSYGFASSFVISLAGGNLYISIVLDSFVMSLFMVYAAYSYYFMFIDLFCDTTFKDGCKSEDFGNKEEDILTTTKVRI